MIDRLELLESQFPRVIVPEQVWNELEVDDGASPDLRTLESSGFLSVVPVERTDLYLEIARELDEGETAAIAHAIETGADLVLLDERDGRQVARRHDLDVTGVLGILLRAADEGVVDLRAEIDALRDAGFWLSDDLVDEILRRARNEGSPGTGDER